MITYRKAIDQDIPGICRLVNLMSPEAGDYRDAIERFEKLIKNSEHMCLWAAIDEDKVGDFGLSKVVGTAMMHYQYKLSYHCGIAAHLEDVVVDPDYRKQGIGEALVVLAMHTAMDKGCYKLMLTCYEKTIPYYEKLGFARHDFGMRMSLKDEYPS